MKKLNMLGILLVSITLLSAAACAPQTQAAATTAPSNTPEVTNQAPTETFEPFASDTPAAPGTQAAPADQTTPDATLEAAGTLQPAAGGASAATATTAPAAPAGGQSSGPVADKYQYISQTLPDGYQVRPNVEVSISWTVKNIGTTAWDKNYSLQYFAGPKPKTTYMAFPKTIAANTTIALTVTFTTPAQPGDYDLWFKLKNSQGQNFGDVDFKFTVTNSPNNSPKPAATATKAP